MSHNRVDATVLRSAVASMYAASVTMRVLQAGGFGSILLGCGE